MKSGFSLPLIQFHSSCPPRYPSRLLHVCKPFRLQAFDSSFMSHKPTLSYAPFCTAHILFCLAVPQLPPISPVLNLQQLQLSSTSSDLCCVVGQVGKKQHVLWFWLGAAQTASPSVLHTDKHWVRFSLPFFQNTGEKKKSFSQAVLKLI